ncbi:MAG: hypothetical protein RR214_05495, partial [Synergistaceae bacterium]
DPCASMFGAKHIFAHSSSFAVSCRRRYHYQRIIWALSNFSTRRRTKRVPSIISLRVSIGACRELL